MSASQKVCFDMVVSGLKKRGIMGFGGNFCFSQCLLVLSFTHAGIINITQVSAQQQTVFKAEKAVLMSSYLSCCFMIFRTAACFTLLPLKNDCVHTSGRKISVGFNCIHHRSCRQKTL